MFQVMGTEVVDYVSKNNKPVKGLKLHCCVENTRVNGCGVETVYLSDRFMATLKRIPKKGDILEILYNKYGSIAEINYREA